MNTQIRGEKVPEKNKHTGVQSSAKYFVRIEKVFKLQNSKNSWVRGGENFTSYRRRGISES